MRNKIDSAVAEVEAQYNAGNVSWNYKTVQSLIGKYPHRGHLDVILPGQEDEATPDPDGVPWEVPGPGGRVRTARPARCFFPHRREINNKWIPAGI